jgi:hypothetical protein
VLCSSAEPHRERRRGGINGSNHDVFIRALSMTKTKMNLKIEHQVPGRVRMKIPAGKGNPELLKQVSETFAVIPGIEHVTVNPTTGSVVLFYDVDRHDEFHGTFRGHYETHGGTNGSGTMHGADTELDKLTSSIEAEAEFLASHSHTARAVVDFVKKIDHEIKLATNNNLDLKIVFAVGIICLTVFEVGATAATPVWVTLAIFTVNHFIQMHEQQNLREANAGPRIAPIKFKTIEPAPAAG